MIDQDDDEPGAGPEQPRRRRSPFSSPLSLRGVVICLVLLVLLLLAFSHPGRVAAKTLLLLPDMFPGSPVRPLTWLTAEPRVEEVAFEFPAGRIDADLYLPVGPGQRGAVILLLGAVGYPRREPTLVRFAEGLARAGAVVMVPESSNLQQGNILPGEVDGLLQAVEYLRARPEVHPERVGFLGFSVGGSMALLAATDPRGVERVAFVNAFGSYYDAREMLIAVASQRILVDGQPVPWVPSDLTVWVFSRQLIQPLPDERDRALLTRAFVDRQPEPGDDLTTLSPGGRTVLELLQAPNRERAVELVSALPPSVQERLDGISPSLGMSRLEAELFLMHDRADTYIPFTQSRHLAIAAPPGTLGRYTEFTLFAHVLPDRPVESLEFVGEVLKLYGHAWDFLQEVL